MKMDFLCITIFRIDLSESISCGDYPPLQIWFYWFYWFYIGCTPAITNQWLWPVEPWTAWNENVQDGDQEPLSCFLHFNCVPVLVVMSTIFHWWNFGVLFTWTQNVKKFCLQRVFRSCTIHSGINVLLGIHEFYRRIPNVDFFVASGYTIPVITKNVNHFVVEEACPRY